MKELPRYEILLGLIVSLSISTIILQSNTLGIALCVAIVALQVESYLDAIRYKKSEEIRQDVKTLADAINTLGQRVAKVELKNVFNGET